MKKLKTAKKITRHVITNSAKKAVQTRKEIDPDALKKMGKRGGKHWGY